MLNCKIVCTKAASSSFTEGRVYEINDGYLVSNHGISRGPYETVDDINKDWGSQFKLIREFKYDDYAIAQAKRALNWFYGSACTKRRLSPKIKKVIFNDPATIILWCNGTKTVVKAQDGDKFDPEKGFAMAIAKYALGNEGNYYEEFKKWLPKEKK